MRKQNVEEDKKRSEYLQQYSAITDLIKEQQAHFDKTLITLSSGAFGLSILFVNSLAPKPIEKWAIVSAWISFALSLALILLSFHFSVLALRRHYALLDKSYYPSDHEHVRDINPYDHLVNILNGSALILFVLGVGFFAWFSGKNILG